MSERISVQSDVCNGRPVIRGTRITAQTALEFLAAGDSVEDILEEFPQLTRADVQECLDYVSGVSKGSREQRVKNRKGRTLGPASSTENKNI
ncbi:MAG TPA: DUF433 domain-containing protein [Verrucomicrobiae bacterium]|jgi:uncharacterized protein (DUF433 family)|nr:DUF433 domain-containing protein [Verrucomicrobiae bacterium]